MVSDGTHWEHAGSSELESLQKHCKLDVVRRLTHKPVFPSKFLFHLQYDSEDNYFDKRLALSSEDSNKAMH